jgi:16S rRNA (guanine966-N2)-methyltransferase
VRIIAGVWGGRRIQAPPGRDVRPTTDRVRESWMAILHPELAGARILDLFAGSGALGLECLSRGARTVTFVEKAPPVAAQLKKNLSALLGDAPDAVGEARVVVADVFRWLPSAEPVDLALADPPYGQGLAAHLQGYFLEHPFARTLWIEHERRDALLPAEALPDGFTQESRRYGDTVLTCIRTPS